MATGTASNRIRGYIIVESRKQVRKYEAGPRTDTGEYTNKHAPGRTYDRIPGVIL